MEDLSVHCRRGTKNAGEGWPFLEGKPMHTYLCAELINNGGGFRGKSLLGGFEAVYLSHELRNICFIACRFLGRLVHKRGVRSVHVDLLYGNAGLGW